MSSPYHQLQSFFQEWKSEPSFMYLPYRTCPEQRSKTIEWTNMCF